MGVPVRRVRHPQPGAAQQHAALHVAARDHVRQWMRVVRVVRGCRRVGTQVLHFVTTCLEPLLELLFHLEAGVVGGDGNYFGHRFRMTDGGWRMGDGRSTQTHLSERITGMAGQTGMLGPNFPHPPSDIRHQDLRGHCGEVRTISATAAMRRTARRSAATYVGIPCSLAISKTPSVVSKISSAFRSARSRVHPATSPYTLITPPALAT